MHIIWLLFSLIGTPAKPVPKVAEAVILVEDQQLRIPPLPRNRLDARWHFKEVQADLNLGKKTVERFLATMATPLISSASKEAVPMAQRPEAEELIAKFKDDHFAEVLGGLLKELKAWEADAKGRVPVTDEQRKGGTAVLEQVPISSQTQAGQTVIDDTTPGGRFTPVDAANGGGVWDSNLAPLLTIQNPNLRATATKREEVAASEGHLMTVARKHETEIARHWALVVQQLDADAKGIALLLDSHPAPDNLGLLELRRRVKVQLLERYQAVLKLCQFIWSGLAAEPKP